MNENRAATFDPEKKAQFKSNNAVILMCLGAYCFWNQAGHQNVNLNSKDR